MMVKQKHEWKSLGEREMLWEQEQTGECFYSFLEVFQTFTSANSIFLLRFIR